MKFGDSILNYNDPDELPNPTILSPWSPPDNGWVKSYFMHQPVIVLMHETRPDPFFLPDVKDKPPFSPGYDVVGVVEKLGDGVTRFIVGQRVADLTVVGAYSEYICMPTSRLTPVPDSLDPAEVASLILSYVTAYQMLHSHLPGLLQEVQAA
jgi:NADPH:quinone reductase-like Zn-dependent oxidoreductase